MKGLPHAPSFLPSSLRWLRVVTMLWFPTATLTVRWGHNSSSIEEDAEPLILWQAAAALACAASIHLLLVFPLRSHPYPTLSVC